MVMGRAWVAAGAATANPGSASAPGTLGGIQEALMRLLGWWPWAVAGASAAVLVGMIAMCVSTWRGLRARREMWALPTPTFEPEAGAVIRLGAVIAGSRRPLRGALSRRADAVRLRLTADAHGKVRHYIGATPRVLGMLAPAMLDEVELRHPEEETRDSHVTRRRRYRIELRLQDSRGPLGVLELAPDPLGPFVEALGALDHETTNAECSIDLQPMSWRAKRHHLSAAMKSERSGRGPSGGWQANLRAIAGMPAGGGAKGANWLFTNEGGGAFGFADSSIARIEDRADDKARHDKLAGAAPLFRAQVLISATAPTRALARDAATQLAAGFDPFTARNRWRPTGLAGLGGAQSLWRRAAFDSRARTGLFWPRALNVVSAAEVAAFLKPPTVHCASAAAARSTGSIPAAPAGLMPYARGAAMLPQGMVRVRGVEALVGVPLAGLHFTLAVGKTRAGKTEKAIGQFLAAVDTAGVGACYFDPHADAVAKARAYLLAHADRVYDLDLSRRATRQAGLNLLSMVGCTEEDIGDKAEAVAGAFGAVLDWDSGRNNRGLNMVTQGVAALLELNLRLPPGLQATIFCLPTLLTDEGWRKEVMPFLSAQSREFLGERLLTQTGGKEATSPATNLVDNLRRNRQVAAVLGQPETTFHLRRAMDTGGIVLMCPPGGGSNKAKLVQALLLFELRRVAATRAELDPQHRSAFHVWADEMQVMDHGAGADMLREILRECGKWGLCFHGLTQQPTALQPETRTTFLTNSFAVTANTLGRDDAAVMAKEWGEDVKPTVLTRMPRYHFLASVTHEGSLTRPFLVRGLSVEQLWGPPGARDDLAALDAAVDVNMRRLPVAEVLGRLDSQPGRILDYLRSTRRPSPSGTLPATSRPAAALAAPGSPRPSRRPRSAQDRAAARWSAQ